MWSWCSKSKRAGGNPRGFKSKPRRALPWGRPAVEILEDRLAPATLTVNSFADNTQADPFLTLRESLLLVDNGGNAIAALGRNLTAGEAAQITGTFGSKDTIQFDAALDGQTITLGSALPQITANLALTGRGASQFAVSGNNTVEVFSIAAGVVAQLSKLTVENGQAANGGGISNAGTLTLTDSTVSGNTARGTQLYGYYFGGVGGGISNTGTLTVTNSTLSGNGAHYAGGGIDNSGTLTVTKSTLSGNASGYFGGGISNSGTLTMTNSILAGNGAHRGGAVVNFGGGTAMLTDITLSGNQASIGGGIANNGTVTLTNSTLSGNSATFGAGGMDNYGTATVTNSTLSGNSATFEGGGIRNRYLLTVTNSTLSGNSAGTFGGGILNNATAAVADSTLSGNSAGAGGGFYNSGLLTVTNGTLSGNSATSGGGGGIYNLGDRFFGGTVTVTNSTLSGNSAFKGGGINNSASGHYPTRTVTLINSTLSGNSAAADGGGIYNAGALTVTNSTLARNQASAGGGVSNVGTAALANSIAGGNHAFGGPDVSGTVQANFSLIQSTDQTVFAVGSSNNITGQDPLLGPLQDNGGPTRTMALLPGSPAIDAGDNNRAVDAGGTPLTTDQRGQPFVRIYGGRVDLGSYEAQPVPVNVAVHASASPSDFGQALMFTAIVSGIVPAFGTPTGSVDFFDTTTATDLGSVMLSGGTASLTTSTLPPGTQTVTVTYSGNSVFLAGSGIARVAIVSSIYVLDPTAPIALGLSGNSSIGIPGLVQVDSSSAIALAARGNARVQAGSIHVVGGFSTQDHAMFSPTPVTGVAPVPDPLAGLPAPTGGILQGSVNLTQGSLTINPGVYNQINVSGTGSLTLYPGIYVIAGGGLAVTGGGSIAGSGVLIYNAGSNYVGNGSHFAGITLTGQGTINLTPASTGPYAGIVIFQSRDNLSAISLSPRAAQAIQDSILYASAAMLSVSGNALVQNTLVVKQLQLNGSGGSAPQVTFKTNVSSQFSQASGLVLSTPADLVVYADLSSGMSQQSLLAQALNVGNTNGAPADAPRAASLQLSPSQVLLLAANNVSWAPGISGPVVSFAVPPGLQKSWAEAMVNALMADQPAMATPSEELTRLVVRTARRTQQSRLVDELFAPLEPATAAFPILLPGRLPH